MASSDPSKRPRPGQPDSTAMPPSSWAKRTGFRPKFSGETNASDSGQITSLPQVQSKPKEPNPNIDLEAGRPKPSPAKPPLPTSNGEPGAVNTPGDKEKEQTPPVRKRKDSDGGGNFGANGQPPAAGEGSRRALRDEAAAAPVDVLPQTALDDDGFVSRHAHMKYELRDTPGLAYLFLFGFYRELVLKQ
ncbi:nucleobase-ascorbate transporter 12 [Olea europaea subsp. europaea]|uniref:Nucleobase-ascorbate transporter 12 n=1 Tax=Olea europaea subsp. europaea TaxID=158383 RepID=A0A8S0QAB1_OLEEU|nr:nucleobase-ascorbate transporter 12 [Olea europaea subsp. europaea]